MSIALAVMHLVVAKTVEGTGHFFVNNEEDNGPSVLCLNDKAQVPTYTEDGPSFTGQGYNFRGQPQKNDKIVALVGPGSTPSNRHAVTWTTGSLWHASALRYVVMHHSPDGSEEIWRGSGVIQLSQLCPINQEDSWEEGGTYWRSLDGLESRQIIAIPPGSNEPYKNGPGRDPRVPLGMLADGRDLSHELSLARLVAA